MEGDEFLCKGCGEKWKAPGDTGPHFCERCYSRDIINLTQAERDIDKKKSFEADAKRRKEEKLLKEKILRHEALKRRNRTDRHYRGKNS